MTFLSGSPAGAEHDEFRHKFPCSPIDTCVFTQESHSNNGLDFVIQPLAGNAWVRAVSEGEVIEINTTSDVCNEEGGHGKFVTVEDIHGEILTYGHLDFPNPFISEGFTVLQGDIIGLQGDTGHTHRENPHIPCADHVHIGEFALVDFIDGNVTSDLVHTHPHLAYPSTNSQIGIGTNDPGVAIRAAYIGQGSWSQVGWTANFIGGHPSCGFFPCGIFVHYEPDPVVGHWGSKQDFRLHPFLQLEYGSLMVGRWAVNEAYVIKPGYFNAWLLGGWDVSDPPARVAIGLPLMDKVAEHPVYCTIVSLCLGYQRFHLGYIWTNAVPKIEVVFCPDLNGDDQVALTDLLLMLDHFGEQDAGLAPYQAWAAARYDVDGNGGVALGDMLLLLRGFGVVCYPV